MHKAGDLTGGYMNHGVKIYPGQEPCPRCGAKVEVFEYTPPATEEAPNPKTYSHWECEDSDCRRALWEKEYQVMWEENRRKDLMESMLKLSDLPKRYKEYRLKDFDPSRSLCAKNAFGAARNYLDNWAYNRENGRGLYLAGDVGTGKTMLAVGIMMELMHKHKVPTLFTTVPDLLDNMRKDIASDEDEEYIGRVKRAEVLIMDDLGAERLTEWSEERLFVIINHRYRASLPTIYTTNVGPDETANRLGTRCASRINASTDGIAFFGEDQRKRKVCR